MKRLSLFLFAYLFVTSVYSNTNENNTTTANGKYAGLLQTLTCPSDEKKYGNYHDYGYWGGGAWCGQTGKAGYWVWVSPSWHVWKRKATNDKTSANGKYSRLLQTLTCPTDRGQYGEYRDYGYWGGGEWCGQTGKKGYWVWVAPTWYVWQNN